MTLPCSSHRVRPTVCASSSIASFPIIRRGSKKAPRGRWRRLPAVEVPAQLAPADPLHAGTQAATSGSRGKNQREPMKIMTGSAWVIEAYLQQPLSSETSKQGETIRAVVPHSLCTMRQHVIAVPERRDPGSGTVTRAMLGTAALGETGVLSFNFQQLSFPRAARPKPWRRG